MNKKTLAAAIIFLLGLGITLYPMISRLYYDTSMQNQTEEIVENLDEDLYQKQVEYNQNSISEPEKIDVANVDFIEEVAPNQDDNTTGNISNEDQSNGQTPSYGADILATLYIPKIDLIYPVYDGATDANLLKGVARIDGTSYPVGGMNTNTVIAGHNGLVNRTYFSHIKDLVPGDIIQIRNQKEVLTYEIYGTAIIEPNDTGALAVVPGQDTVTLLTCTWPPPGTHRYLVYAKRVLGESLESVVLNK